MNVGDRMTMRDVPRHDWLSRLLRYLGIADRREDWHGVCVRSISSTEADFDMSFGGIQIEESRADGGRGE